ncbi:MAG: sugar transferase [Synergistaceae bacterium]|jgi:undecaprenyl-phosphate galactose phosphotransferase|nr:sugar transferase [Synergistaceae bacterium]
MKDNVFTEDAALNSLPVQSAFYVAKRLTVQLTQVALDFGVYWVCLGLVLSLWTSIPGVLQVERKLFLSGVFLVCFAFNSLYEFKSWMFWDEMRAVLKASVTATVIVIVALFTLRLPFSRVAIFVSAALFAPSCLVGRYFFRRLLFGLGLLKTRILIIGAGKTGELYAKKIKEHSFMSCEVVGFLDDDAAKWGTTVVDVPVLGGVEDFAEIQQNLNVGEVVVAIPSSARDLRAHILDIAGMRVKRVSYIPDMYMLTTFTASMRDVDGVPVISSSRNPVNLIKTMMDWGGALIALFLFSPIFLYVAYRIKKDDGGSVFFTQTRMGHNMVPFTMYKFRTMVPNAEQKLKEMLKDETLRQEYEISFKLKNDPRVTKIGHFLRKSSLDELPQLFNVLKGEMSLVGPRPFVPWEIETRYGEMARQIYSVKPGLTGLWQVSGRNDILDYQQSKDLDLYYTRNWSLWLDIVILFRTIQIIINADGAY